MRILQEEFESICHETQVCLFFVLLNPNIIFISPSLVDFLYYLMYS